MAVPTTAGGQEQSEYLFHREENLDDFRRTVRDWLGDNLVGEFARPRGAGGPGREHEAFEERLAWDRHLAAAGWTRCAAVEAAEHGIRVNAVAPSLAMHPFLAKVTSEELLAELASREVFGRAAEPWEVANVMIFLASDYASYLTGEVVSVSSQHP